MHQEKAANYHLTWSLIYCDVLMGNILCSAVAVSKWWLKPEVMYLNVVDRTDLKCFHFHVAVGNIEIIRCPDGYEVGDVYCTKSDTGVVDYDAQYPFETASYIAREILRKVQVRKSDRLIDQRL